MITYATLKETPRRFLAMTSLTVDEFDRLVPTFAAEYAATQSSTQTQANKPRRRRPGGGRTPQLVTTEDKLLFILTYFKTYPLQTAHGLHFGLSQSQTNEWIHRLTPLLERTLTQLNQMPERDPGAFQRREANAPPPELMIDGTERRRQRPKNAKKQREHYSGKKKAHTDKNVLVTHERTHRIEYLSRTRAGSVHDKKVAEQENIRYPVRAVLTKDTGFQGYEPEGVWTIQPKKTPKGKWLGLADQLANRLISQVRIKIEHVIASLKRCRIVKDVFRNTQAGFSDTVMGIACALHNLRTNYRPLPLLL